MVLACLCLHACSGGGGLTCEEACGKLVECGQEQDEDRCVEECSEIKGVIRTSSWNELWDCIMEPECSVHSPDACMQQAAANSPTNGLDTFINDVCTKMVSCEPQYTHEQCVADMQENIGNDAWIMNLVKESILQCVSDCIDGLDCSELETGIDACMESCGLNF
jgi:hypothetical protein